MRLIWLTDLHLNFAPRAQAEALAAEVRAAAPDAVLLGGDTADAPILADRLALFADALAPVPVAFVLGNHDFYHGSLTGVTRLARQLCAQKANLHWLGGEGPLPLGEGVALVGADGWGDGGYGNRATQVRLNDSALIEELRAAADPMALCADLGQRTAKHLRRALQAAAVPQVVTLTHVPPFPEAALYQSKPSGADYAPFFVCRATGDVLREAAQANPEREYLVLCGHTHEACEAQVLPNLRVFTGGARYRHPAIQRVLEMRAGG